MIKLRFDIKFMGKITPRKILYFLRIHNYFYKWINYENILADLEDIFKKSEIRDFKYYIDNLKQSYGEDYTYFSDNIVIIKAKKGSFGALGIKGNSAFVNLFFRFKSYDFHRKELNKIIKRIEYTIELNDKQIDRLNDKMDKENKDLYRFIYKRLEKDKLYNKYLYELRR